MSVEICSYPSNKDPESTKEKSFKYKVMHSSGAHFSVINYGATITSICVKDKNGRTDDIVLGFSSLDEYMGNGACHGAVVGRHANRIKGAVFRLNHAEYHLPKNDGPNNLHGGSPSFQNIFWHGAVLPEEDAKVFLLDSHIQNDFELDGDAVLFSCLSTDGACGFPGNLNASVMYAWTKDLTLLILYRGESDMDTLFNPTNHAYFNLKRHDSGSVARHTLWIDAERMTNKDSENVPDGTFSMIRGTIFDFSNPAPLGPTMTNQHPQLLSSRGIDQNYCLSTIHSKASRTASLSDPDSGRIMDVITNSPGLQIYAGNHIGGYAGKSGSEYVQYAGVCLETQHYPDAIHHSDFPSPVLCAHTPCYYITGYRYSSES